MPLQCYGRACARVTPHLTDRVPLSVRASDHRRQQLIGRPQLVVSGESQPLVVATDQNVLAAVNHKTGAYRG